MSNCGSRRLTRRRIALALLLTLSYAVPARAAGQTTLEWIVLRMRSFVPGAGGRLNIEPTSGGGRVRLTVLGLPRASSVAPAARSYVVWANSEGRFARLGELQLDERGNGGLEFERPGEFERYSVMVTAEADATLSRPAGAPVLSTKANEVRAAFPVLGKAPKKDTETDAKAAEVTTAPATTDAARATRPRVRETKPEKPPKADRYVRSHPSRPGDFYSEVDDALEAQGGGRVLELVGAEASPGARARASATARTGSAYVRARFRDLPLPSAVGADTYVLWGSRPDGRIVYMGSLPATSDLNEAFIYVRTGGFDADDYYLFVTAERQRPVPRPSDRRALNPRPVTYEVK